MPDTPSPLHGHPSFDLPERTSQLPPPTSSVMPSVAQDKVNITWFSDGSCTGVQRSVTGALSGLDLLAVMGCASFRPKSKDGEQDAPSAAKKKGKVQSKPDEMVEETAGEFDRLTILRAFHVAMMNHMVYCRLHREQEILETRSDGNVFVPPQWLVLFFHFVARQQQFEKYGSGGADWVWHYFLRGGRESTVVPLLQQLGLVFGEEFQRNRKCLQELGLEDENPAPLAVGSLPPLQLTAGEETSESSIVEQIKDAGVCFQDQALLPIASLVYTRLFDLAPTRPAVILMPGPMATGKTTTAEALVQVLFGKSTWADPLQRNTVFLRIDLNNFVDEHSTARLLGADAGLVTSDTSKGVLIEWLENIHDAKVPDRPISGVLLLDELEKAGKQAQILNRLMGLMESGNIVGANTGRLYRAAKLVILCATNAGSEALAPAIRAGEVAASTSIAAAVRQEIVAKCCGGEPAAFSRFDKIAYYRGFNAEGRKSVILETIQKRLQAATAVQGKNTFTWELDPADHTLVDFLDKFWLHENINARAVRNFCQRFDILAANLWKQLKLSRPPGDAEIPSKPPMRPHFLLCCDGTARKLVARMVDGDLQQAVDLPPLASSDGYQLLHVAILEHEEPAPVLHAMSPSSVQAQVALVDRWGRTALHYAASRGDVPSVRFLCEHGSPVGASDIYGFTPIMMAVHGYCLTAGNRWSLRAFSEEELRCCQESVSIMLNRYSQYPSSLLASHASAAQLGVHTAAAAAGASRATEMSVTQPSGVAPMDIDVNSASAASAPAASASTASAPTASASANNDAADPTRLHLYRELLGQQTKHTGRTALLLAFDVLYQDGGINLASDTSDGAADQLPSLSESAALPSLPAYQWAQRFVTLLLLLMHSKQHFEEWRQRKKAARVSALPQEDNIDNDSAYVVETDSSGRSLGHRLFRLHHNERGAPVAAQHHPFAFLSAAELKSTNSELETQYHHLVHLSVLSEVLQCSSCTQRILALAEMTIDTDTTCLHVHPECTKALEVALLEAASCPQDEAERRASVIKNWFLRYGFQVPWHSAQLTTPTIRWFIDTFTPAEWGLQRPAHGILATRGTTPCSNRWIQPFEPKQQRQQEQHLATQIEPEEEIQDGDASMTLARLHFSIFDWFNPMCRREVEVLDVLQWLVEKLNAASLDADERYDLHRALFSPARPLTTFAALYLCICNATLLGKWEDVSDVGSEHPRMRALCALDGLLHLLLPQDEDVKGAIHFDYWHDIVLSMHPMHECPYESATTAAHVPSGAGAFSAIAAESKKRSHAQAASAASSSKTNTSGGSSAMEAPTAAKRLKAVHKSTACKCQENVKSNHPDHELLCKMAMEAVSVPNQAAARLMYPSLHAKAVELPDMDARAASFLFSSHMFVLTQRGTQDDRCVKDKVLQSLWKRHCAPDPCNEDSLTALMQAFFCRKDRSGVRWWTGLRLVEGKASA